VNDEVLLRVEHVSKKFCRSLRRSLWYGVRDVGSALLPWSNGRREGGNAESAINELPALRRDEFLAIRDISFELRRGECLGLIGHNGAGKSTLLKMLNGLIPPDSGTITARGRVASLIDLNVGFNPILTGRENIYNGAALLGFSPEATAAKFDQIVEFAEMSEFLDMPVQNYSSGMRVRLGFAVAAQMEPDILLIDEVLAVGDVAFRFKCLNAIGELMNSAAVVFVSHSMPQIYRLCNEVIVMNHGSATYQGSNIADGVAMYLSLFKESKRAVSGSGEVSLTGLSAESDGRVAGMGETLEIAYGSRLRLSMRLNASRPIEGRIQFLVWNAEMLPVLDVMSEDLGGYPVEFPETGSIEVTADVPRIDLNGGKYTVSVIAASRDYSRNFCRHDNAMYLQVSAETTSGAHVLAVAGWSASYSSQAE
jgi:lipopolysaccharide transport system ATP-binding protein